MWKRSLFGLIGMILLLSSCSNTNKNSNSNNNNNPADTCSAPTDSIYYVKTSGSDSTGTGSSDCPYSTIKTTIDAMVSAGVTTGEVHVAAGIYEVTDPIEMVEGISLKGGFSNSDWRDREYLTAAERSDTTYQTIVKYIGTNDGELSLTSPVVMAPAYAIGATASNITNSTVVEGFTVNAKDSGTFTASIAITNGADPTIQYNTMNGSATATATLGVGIINAKGYITNNQIDATGSSTFICAGVGVFGTSGDIRIESNTIDGGTLSGDNGIDSGIFLYMVTSGTAIIESNTIDGGTATLSSIYGILAIQSSNIQITSNNIINAGTSITNDASGIGISGASNVQITSNDINGGHALSTNAARGIDVENGSSNIQISSNYIDAGEGGGRTRGISIGGDSTDVDITNNVIIGGHAVTGESSVMRADGSSTFSLLNNTIICGISDGGFTNAISTSDTVSGRIENNILYFAGDHSLLIGAIIAADSSRPSSIKNNDFYGFNILYSDATEGTYTDVSTLNSIVYLTPGASGNVSDTPIFADVDYRLEATTPTSIKEGGIDLSAEFTVDKDGVTRTAPWSMGAYEKDPVI